VSTAITRKLHGGDSDDDDEMHGGGPDDDDEMHVGNPDDDEMHGSEPDEMNGGDNWI
jgi:hypothetical protein